MLAREQEAQRIAAALSFPEALEQHRKGELCPAELAAVYLAERVFRAAGARWLQADRRDRLPLAERASPWLRLFAERELCRVPQPVPRALVAWGNGQRPVQLYFHVPAPRALLALQAKGQRCVSLLADGVPTAPHEDGLAFAVHDLCHLEKFVDPTFYAEQVGFFSLLDRAIDDPRWAAMEAPFDALYRDERDHVLADMNGSAVFLFLVLKNKLKLAVRRQVARERGAPSPTGGPLDAGERAALTEVEEQLFALLDLRGREREAAIALSTRSDAAEAAEPLIARFRAEGEDILSAGVRANAPDEAAPWKAAPV